MQTADGVEIRRNMIVFVRLSGGGTVNRTTKFRCRRYRVYRVQRDGDLSLVPLTGRTTATKPPCDVYSTREAARGVN